VRKNRIRFPSERVARNVWVLPKRILAVNELRKVTDRFRRSESRDATDHEMIVKTISNFELTMQTVHGKVDGFLGNFIIARTWCDDLSLGVYPCRCRTRERFQLYHFAVCSFFFPFE
jgi:hypothetical protein